MNDYSELLVDKFVAAAKRHDDILDVYTKAVTNLFDEITKVINSLEVRVGFDTRSVFKYRTESEEGLQALVIKSNITNKNHSIGRTVLNLHATGLGYSLENGGLCGFLQVIASDGDYWELAKKSKFNPLVGITVGMVSPYALAGMVFERNRRNLDSIENISREAIDLLWVRADSPGDWFIVMGDKESQPINVQEYAINLLERFYNPEFKDWTHKGNLT